MSKKRGLKSNVSLILSLVMVCFMFSNILVKAETNTKEVNIFTSDFEDGNMDGWCANGGGKLEVSEDVANSGVKSLKCTERTAFYNNPNYDLLLNSKAGDTINFSTWIFWSDDSEEATTQKFNVTANIILDGNESWNQIDGAAGVEVESNKWTEIKGTYTVPEGEITKLAIYPEFVDQTILSDIYLDDVKITKTVTVEEVEIVTSDFEDGNVGAWTNNYGGTLEVSEDTAHTGKYSLKHYGRTEAWHTPNYDLVSSVKGGDVISFSAWVYWGKDIVDDTVKNFNVTMASNIDGADAWNQIDGAAGIPVKNNEWTEIKGTYTVPTGTITKLSIYPEFADGDKTSDMYIDDVKITKVVSEEDKEEDEEEEEELPGSNLKFNFDDGTTEGWVIHDHGTVEASKDFASSGEYSLKYSDREATNDGPVYDMLGKAQGGQVINFDGKVYYNGDVDTSTMCISLNYIVDGKEDWKQLLYNAAVPKGEWTTLSGSYTVPKGELTKLNIYVETAYYPNPEDGDLGDFYIDDVNIEVEAKTSIEIQRDIPSVYETYSKYFPMGVALEPYQVTDSEAHAELVKKHFNSVVAENEMKMQNVQPTEGNFTFEKADALVEFCIENDIMMRGHTLLWHQAVGPWMFERKDGTPMEAGNAADKELLFERLETHIKTVLGHFEEKYGDENPIYCWDVVNEVIEEDGNFRNSLWYQISGDEYIYKAFELARKYAPQGTKLYINDYNLENPAKIDGLYEVVKRLNEASLIDGVGYQAHIDINSPEAGTIERIIERFEEFNLDFQITELDMAGVKSDDLLPRQAKRYKEIFEMLKRKVDEGSKITGVTFWGLGDDHTWLTMPEFGGPGEMPLLFDEKLQAKLAYWAVVDPSKLPIYIEDIKVNKAVVDEENKLNWDYAKSFEIKSIIEGHMEAAKGKISWDEKNIYLKVDVVDETISAEDGVEIFIDKDNSNSEFNENDKMIKVNSNGTITEATDVKATSKKTENGYTLIVIIPMEEDYLVENSKIGFDVKVNDYEGENLKGSAVWNDLSGKQNESTVNYGTITLTGLPKFTEAIKGTPIIDGILDGAWKDAIEEKTGIFVSGEGATAKFKTMWDENYVYVYAVVEDSNLDNTSPNVYEHDSIEVFMDENNAKTTSYQNDDGQYRINYENLQSFGGCANKVDIKSATKVVDGGYIVEVAIPIEKGEANKVVGFDVQVNDGEGGSRQSIAIWADALGNGWQDTTGFGNLKLVDNTDEPEEPGDDGDTDKPVEPENPDDDNDDTDKPSVDVDPDEEDNDEPSTDEEDLPQTGSIISSTWIIIFAMMVIATGVGISRKKTVKK